MCQVLYPTPTVTLSTLMTPMVAMEFPSLWSFWLGASALGGQGWSLEAFLLRIGEVVAPIHMSWIPTVPN